MNGGCLMQGRDIAETDDRFGDGRNTVNDTLQSVPASGTEDAVHRGIAEGVDQIGQTIFVRSGKTTPCIARVRALAHYISPRAQAC